MKRKNLSSRCSSHVCQHARENISQKELFIVAYILEYMEYTGCMQMHLTSPAASADRQAGRLQQQNQSCQAYGLRFSR